MQPEGGTRPTSGQPQTDLVFYLYLWHYSPVLSLRLKIGWSVFISASLSHRETTALPPPDASEGGTSPNAACPTGHCPSPTTASTPTAANRCTFLLLGAYRSNGRACRPRITIRRAHRSIPGPENWEKGEVQAEGTNRPTYSSPCGANRPSTFTWFSRANRPSFFIW